MSDLRANQKERTRAAIVEAAGRLVREGKAPSVAEAAKAAKVSRATAYRYFPTPEALHIEVAGVTPVFEPVEQLVQSLEGDDVEARPCPFPRCLLRRQLRRGSADADGAQGLSRNLVRLAGKDGASAARCAKGGACGCSTRCWRPRAADLSEAQWQRLKSALALTSGPDAMVVMKDVCRLDNETALGDAAVGGAGAARIRCCAKAKA